MTSKSIIKYSIDIALTTLGELLMVLFKIFLIVLLIALHNINFAKRLTFDTVTKNDLMLLAASLDRIAIIIYPYSRLIHYIIFN